MLLIKLSINSSFLLQFKNLRLKAQLRVMKSGRKALRRFHRDALGVISTNF